jgi:AraC-like DNA-binding protein
MTLLPIGMSKQTYRPRNVGIHNTGLVSTIGLDNPGGMIYQNGREWRRHRVCRHDTFSLILTEFSPSTSDDISYTRLEDYVVINLWLSGKHTTVLDGVGQHEHDRPEIFITSGAHDTIKMHLIKRNAPVSVVAMCLLREFFPEELGMDVSDLPEPLRTMVQWAGQSPGFCRFPLTNDLAAAARAVIAAPFEMRHDAIYSRAKCVELGSLLINRLRSCSASQGTSRARNHHQSRLYKAKHLIEERYAEPITLEEIARDVGLSRVALTTGFRDLFSMSVHDCLQEVRMAHAYALLQDQQRTVSQVADAVGFGYACNFSTAFKAHFGCNPQTVRAGEREVRETLNTSVNSPSTRADRNQTKETPGLCSGE